MSYIPPEGGFVSVVDSGEVMELKERVATLERLSQRFKADFYVAVKQNKSLRKENEELRNRLHMYGMRDGSFTPEGIGELDFMAELRAL